VSCTATFILLLKFKNSVLLCEKHCINKNINTASLFVQLAVASIQQISLGSGSQWIHEAYNEIYGIDTTFSLFHFWGSVDLDPLYTPLATRQAINGTCCKLAFSSSTF